MTPTPCYASARVDIHIGSMPEALVSIPYRDSAVVVGRDVARVLEQCGPPRSLAAHAAHVASTLRLEELSVQKVLTNLLEEGLLLRVDLPQATGNVTADEVVDVLVVPTCDRPDLLARCLASYRAHFERLGRDPIVFVSDGSRTRVGSANTRAIVDSVRDRGRGRTVYFGQEGREAMRRASVRAGFEADIVTWLLPDPPLGYAAGATRNLALLNAAGHRILMVDDDTVCSPRARRARPRGIALVGHQDPRETDWFTSRTESVRAWDEVHCDLLQAHGDVLGRPLVELCAGTSPVDLARSCRHLMGIVAGDRSGRVRLSWVGVAGDSAAYCPHGILFCSGASRDALASNELLFQSALRSREVFRAVPQTTVTDEPAVMTYCAGVDNTQLVPPFSPVGYNEDGQFGWMLRACDPSALVAQLPLAVVHDSLRPSEYQHTGILSASQVRTTEVMKWLCGPWLATCVASDSAERMKSLASFLLTLANMPPDDFQMHLRRTVIDGKWQAVARCDATQKRDFRYPAFWQVAFRQYTNALLTSTTAPGFYLPIEWRSADLSAGLLAFQRHLGMYARALKAWPELWQYWRGAQSTTAPEHQRCS